MTTNELQKAIELQYQSKGIAKCRYNALNKAVSYTHLTLPTTSRV